jgi:hypothetical protein
MEQTNDQTTTTTTTPLGSSATSPFDRLAVVELQLILQYCDLTTLLRLAGTSRTIRRAADAAHVWEHRTPLIAFESSFQVAPRGSFRLFIPACFSPHAILLRRHPLIGDFARFTGVREHIRYEQLHLVDLWLVDGKAFGLHRRMFSTVRCELVAAMVDQPLSACNWRIHTLTTSVAQMENTSMFALPTFLQSLRTLELQAEDEVDDGPRMAQMLTEWLKPMAQLRTLKLCSRSTIDVPTLCLLKDFGQLTSLRLEMFQDDAILELLFFTRGPLFSSLESLELHWIAPMDAGRVKKQVMERRRDEVAARINTGGDSITLAHFTSLTHLALECTRLSPLLLPRLRTIPLLRSLHYTGIMSYTVYWGSPFPEASGVLLESTLEENPLLEITCLYAWDASRMDGSGEHLASPPADLAPFVDLGHPRVHVREKERPPGEMGDRLSKRVP